MRFVFNDLTGYQEEVDLSFWDEFDPMEYLKDTRIKELKERVERLEKPWWKRIF